MNPTNFNLLLPILIIASLAGIILTITKSMQSRISEIQKRVLVENPGLASSQSFPAVYRSRPPARISLLPNKVVGIITIREKEIGFIGYSKSQPVKLAIPFQGSTLAWAGTNTTPFSRSSWFEIRQAGKAYYFSAETSKLFTCNEKSSMEIFNNINSILAPGH